MAGHAFFSQAIPHLIKAAAESGGSPFIQWCDSHGSHTSFYSQTLFEAGIKVRLCCVLPLLLWIV